MLNSYEYDLGLVTSVHVYSQYMIALYKLIH
jgi:hypothetical protein